MFLSNVLSRLEQSTHEDMGRCRFVEPIVHACGNGNGAADKAFPYGAAPEALLIAALLRRLSHEGTHHG